MLFRSKNVHWALCTGVFGKRDVGRIEREFLDVLDYELGLTEADLLSHHNAIMSLTQAQRVRFHQRSHAVSAPASPQRHHHHHQAQPVRVKLTPPSRWSNGSDMSDSDDSLSSTMSPPPQTPEMDVDAPFVPVALAKQTPEDLHSAAHPITVVRTPAPPMHSKASTTDIHAQGSSHTKLASALQILRAIPIPHFHSSSSSSSLAPSPASSAESSAVSSSASSVVSIPAPFKQVHVAVHPRSRPAVLQAY